MIKDDYVLKKKYDERVAEGNAWWHNYCVTMNKFMKANGHKVAIGCALNPNEPLTSERRYVE
tara:strand:+ start:1693 stop:1878 length:186 start_codon:yes stop_codon:yes gene_type:complete